MTIKIYSNLRELQADCPSTHGGAGYASDSYWDGDAIICGLCGKRIEDPLPTGSRFEEAKGIAGLFFGKGRIIPTWNAKGKPSIKMIEKYTRYQ